ncbi:MAG: hypothetical protein JNK15_09385 [Planctomycetes bacterium]|nr:hypothetical protein [Planctomycetota bacterium]
MNELELERSLRGEAAVETEVVARVQAAVRAAAQSLPAEPVPAIAPTWRAWLVVAACACVGAWIAWGTAVGQDSPHEFAVRVDPSAVRDFGEPPGLSGLMAEADVVARVIAKRDGRTFFQEILRGGEIVRADEARTGKSLLATSAGALADGTHLLFLARAEGNGAFVVACGDRGQVPLRNGLYWDVFTYDDVAAVVRTGTLDPARIVELLATHGPFVLNQITWHLQQLPGWKMPSDHPGFQATLAKAFAAKPPCTDDRHAFLAAVGHLHADGVRLLSPAALDRYRAAWLALAPDNDPRFLVDHVLGPVARANVPWARQAVVEQLDALDAAVAQRGKLAIAVSEHVDNLAVLAAWAPADAARRAAALRPFVAAKERDDHDRLLAAMVRWGHPDAVQTVADEFATRFAAGEKRVPLGPLLLCPPALVAPLLESSIEDASFGERFFRYDPVLREVLAESTPNPVLAALRPVLAARVADRGQSFHSFGNHLRLHEAAGGALAEATALPHFLTTAFETGWSGRELVQHAERRLGRRELTFAEPTDAELRIAAAALARALQ